MGFETFDVCCRLDDINTDNHSCKLNHKKKKNDLTDCALAGHCQKNTEALKSTVSRCCSNCQAMLLLLQGSC